MSDKYLDIIGMKIRLLESYLEEKYDNYCSEILQSPTAPAFDDKRNAHNDLQET